MIHSNSSGSSGSSSTSAVVANDYQWLSDFLTDEQFEAFALTEARTPWIGTLSRKHSLDVTSMQGTYSGTAIPVPSQTAPVYGTVGGTFPASLTRWALTIGNMGIPAPYIAGSGGTLTPVTMAAESFPGGWRVKTNTIFTGTTPLSTNTFLIGVRNSTVGLNIVSGTENNHCFLCVDVGGAVKMRTRDTTAQTVGSTITTVVDNAAYEYELVSVPGVSGKVFYRVKVLSDGTEFTGEVTANLPASSVSLRLAAMVYNASGNSKWGFNCIAMKVY